MISAAQGVCRKLLGQAPFPVMMVGKAGDVIFRNEAACELLGDDPGANRTLFSPGAPDEVGTSLISGLIEEALDNGLASESVSLPGVRTRDPLRDFRPGQWQITVSADNDALLVVFAPADAHVTDQVFELPSPREMQVIGLAADGASAKSTARALGISPATVPQHLASAKLKLSAHTPTEAVARAVGEGLLRPRRRGEEVVGFKATAEPADDLTSLEVVYMSGETTGVKIGQSLDLRGVSVDGSIQAGSVEGIGRALLGPLGLEWTEMEDGRHAQGLVDLFGPYERVFLATARRSRLFLLLQQARGT